MKIGIITYHRALNYGAVLQAYALQRYLEKIGIDSDIIDYRCPYIEYFYKPLKASFIKQTSAFFRELIYYKNNYEKRRKFESFIKKNIKTSQTVSTKKELTALSNEYDYIFTGSDQVWNFKWSGFDKAYFLDFCESDKKFSYAASFGFDKIPENQREEYKHLLQDFQRISVRESSGKEIIEDLLSRKDAIISLDPTCLIDSEEWDEILEEPKEKGYVLVYTLENSPKLIDYAIRLSKKKGVKLFYISDAKKKTVDAKYKGFMSPAEFVGLYKNAGYVVTNSFHGLMFSVIFKKQFYLAYQECLGAPNARLVDFIADFRLTKRVLKEKTELFEEEIDYSFIREKMLSKIEETRKYFISVESVKLKKNITIPKSKELCCGCRACQQICSKDAISMIEDKEGFLYPKIDERKCVKCGKCINTCEFQKKALSAIKKPLELIVAYHKNQDIRSHSRSGGVFVALSDIVLSRGGVVYGTAFNNDFSVSHKKAENEEERNYFCGSKYVQSDTEKTFISVFEDIKKDRIVLYSGTGCQIGALLSFLRNKGINIPCANLITVDIVCHGVMSPKVWRDNLKMISEKYGLITAVDFRDKSFGWDSHIESYIINGEKITSRLYTDVFYDHKALRQSCYACPYASIQRDADITLADAWGVKRGAPEWDSSKGVSLVFGNTKKGVELFKMIEYSLEVKKAELNIYMQPNMQCPTKRPADRDDFWQKYNEKGFEFVANVAKKNQENIVKKNNFKSKAVKIMRILHLK